MRYIAITTDNHIVEPGHKLGTVDTSTTARRVFEQIKSEEHPVELIVDLGDIGDSALNPDRATAIATAESYEHVKKVIATAGPKVLHIPGNHDDPETMYKILGNNWETFSSGCATYALGGVTLVAVDFRTGSEATGLFQQSSQSPLQEILAKSSKVIILSHYPWYRSNQVCADEFSITNPDQFLQVIFPYRHKIIAAFHGHMHTWMSWVQHGIPIYCLTGSSMEFKIPLTASSIKEIKVDPDGRIGYYLVGLQEDGEMIVKPRMI